ncbi:MAG TPA: SRPBCC domain-containing protein [Pirellulales bacterium]|nr:SRPBCC domain-containing protein [Pirellulales bacterium]
MSGPIEFTGVEHFTSSPDRVFAAMTDLDMVASIIPDLQSTERIDDRTLRCVVRPGFSFLRGTLKMTVALVDVQPATSATMRVDATGIGVSMRVDSQLQLSPEGAGTKLAWTARVAELKGLVATISPALVRASADQITRTAWQKIHGAVA